MKDFTERNNMAIDKVAKILGFEDPITIWFGHEVEINPCMSTEELTQLTIVALRDDEWDDEDGE